jgi:uncharacterized protein (TIGR03437 family)
MKRVLCALVMVCGVAAGKPKIADKEGVRTLATVADRGAMARGSVFEVRGEALAAEGAATLVELASKDGVKVEAAVVSAVGERVVAVAPVEMAPGEYQVTVSVGGEASGAAAVKVVERNFGLITNTGSYGGMVRARVLQEGMEPVEVTLAAAVAAGATVELEATGLGGASVEARVMLGGRELEVLAAGPDETRPGYDKVVVKLPGEEMEAGCLVLLKVAVGEAETVAATLPVLAPEETMCRHPWGLTEESLRTLAAGGSLIHGGFTLVKMTGLTSAAGMTFESKIEQMSGGFVRFTAEAVAWMSANALIAAAYDAKGCLVHDALVGPGGEYVDAGESLKLAGPAWTVNLPRGTVAGQGLNQYNLTLDSRFNGMPLPMVPPPPGLQIAPGKYTLTGTGGTVVGPFEVEVEASPELVWTNRAAVAEIDTGNDLTLTWTGAGAADTVTASGLVRGPAPEDTARIVNRVWVCKARGDAGSVTVPAELLKKLPRVSAAELADPKSDRYASLSLAAQNPPELGNFRAPLTEGGTTELVAFLASSWSSRSPVVVK